jgi:hypothetical protein
MQEWGKMKGVVLGLIAACLITGQAIGEENAANAIRTFGLIGSWSIDCTKTPTQTCVPNVGCGARTIYEVSSTGSPTITNLVGTLVPGQSMSIETVVESAERIGDDGIRIVSVQQGVPGQFSKVTWIRQPGERWETVLMKVGPKYRWLSHQRQDGTKIEAKDGFAVRPPPGTKYNEIPTTWVTSDKPTPLFERCSD